MRVLLFAFSVIGGLLGAEAFLRLLSPSALDFKSGNRPGPYVMLENFGPHFGYPGYQGVMRVPGTTIAAKVELNELGIRVARTSSDTPGKSVVVIGGLSQSYGFGLPFEQSWPARLAHHACSPITVYSVSMPGTRLLTDWHYFTRFVSPTVTPDILVASHYAVLDWTSQLTPIQYDEPDPLDYDIIDGWLRPVAVSGSLLAARIQDNLLPNPNPIPQIDARTRKQRAIGSASAYTRLNEILLAEAQSYGARLAMVHLPDLIQNEGNKFDEYNAVYSRIVREAGPSAIPNIDLVGDLIGSPLQRERLPDTHYNAVLHDYIGRRVAEGICDLVRRMD